MFCNTYVMCTLHFVMVYVLWRCTLCDVYVLKTLRFETLTLCAAASYVLQYYVMWRLHYVALHYVTTSHCWLSFFYFDFIFCSRSYHIVFSCLQYTINQIKWLNPFLIWLPNLVWIYKKHIWQKLTDKKGYKRTYLKLVSKIMDRRPLPVNLHIFLLRGKELLKTRMQSPLVAYAHPRVRRPPPGHG